MKYLLNIFTIFSFSLISMNSLAQSEEKPERKCYDWVEETETYGCRTIPIKEWTTCADSNGNEIDCLEIVGYEEVGCKTRTKRVKVEVPC